MKITRELHNDALRVHSKISPDRENDRAILNDVATGWACQFSVSKGKIMKAKALILEATA